MLGEWVSSGTVDGCCVHFCWSSKTRGRRSVGGGIQSGRDQCDRKLWDGSDQIHSQGHRSRRRRSRFDPMAQSPTAVTAIFPGREPGGEWRRINTVMTRRSVTSSPLREMRGKQSGGGAWVRQRVGSRAKPAASSDVYNLPRDKPPPPTFSPFLLYVLCHASGPRPSHFLRQCPHPRRHQNTRVSTRRMGVGLTHFLFW
ncbi:hypothetical protein B0H14DRAFT_1040567 [Mycena olivaceomarginata]|nr:hypothetical protein B0H14DRAFT_1040567 [Mycena olivaceomarginata]